MRRVFDVICAGEALWSLSLAGGAFAARWGPLRFRPNGGAVNAALALARRGMRVGLATTLGNDALGRALVARIEAAGIDVDAVSLATPRGALALLQRTLGTPAISTRDETTPFAVPGTWSAKVLLLSGVTPGLAYGAALCKAARAARREGATVVLDVNARASAWAGHDPRTVRSLLREADVVRCSADDRIVLGIDAATLRTALRPDAILVTTNAAGDTTAAGPFGDITRATRRSRAPRAVGAGDEFTAAMCAEIARAGHADERSVELWDRALAHGDAAANETGSR
jgi:2-dehydro-3-deoxygluconokinase